MFQRKPVSPLKAIAIVGAVALLLLPTYILVRQDLQLARLAKEPLAVVAITMCGHNGVIVIDGAGRHTTLDNVADDKLEAIGEAVPHGNALMVELPCAGQDDSDGGTAAHQSQTL